MDGGQRRQPARHAVPEQRPVRLPQPVPCRCLRGIHRRWPGIHTHEVGQVAQRGKGGDQPGHATRGERRVVAIREDGAVSRRQVEPPGVRLGGGVVADEDPDRGLLLAPLTVNRSRVPVAVASSPGVIELVDPRTP